MGKTMKYEMIRGKTILISLAGILGGAEFVFLMGILLKKTGTVSLGITFLILGAGAAYFTIWLLGLISFGRDLREKSGYMIFLTPVSPFKIVIAKLLVALIELFAAAGILVGLVVVDLNILHTRYKMAVNILKEIARWFNVGMDDLMAAMVVAVVTSTISVLTLYTIAYLCAAISAMISKKPGGSRGSSIVLIIIVLIIYYVISLNLPEIVNHSRNLVVRGFIEKIPRYIFYIAGIIGCSWGTGWLLDKKVSL